MSRKDDIQQQLFELNRRLQNLRVEKGRKGIDTPHQTLAEIEDIEVEVSGLQTELKAIADKEAEVAKAQRELKQLDPGWRQSDPAPAPPPAPVPINKDSQGLSPVVLSLLMVTLGGVVGAVLAAVFWPPDPVPSPTPTATQVAAFTTQTPTVQEKALPDVSLLSMSYVVDAFDPRRVDLLNVSDSGIPVSAGNALRLFDINLLVSDKAAKYKVAAEVYLAGTNILIGSTKATSPAAGMVTFPEIDVKEGFRHNEHPNAWDVNQEWDDLLIAFIAYGENNDSTVLMRRNIHLDPQGMAWFYEPPNLNFISLVYSINDGPEAVLDLRSPTETGLQVQPGDELSLKEVWYRSNTPVGDRAFVHLEAHLGAEFNEETFDKTKEPELIRPGINNLRDIVSLRSWVIPDTPETQLLSIFLLRSSSSEESRQVIMDRMQISLSSQGSSGLAPVDETVRWPFGRAEYIDFETPDALLEWTTSEKAAEFITLDRTVEPAFSGGYALAVTASADADTPLVVLNRDDRPFRANLIVGQVFWPDQTNGTPVSAQACLDNAPEVCTTISVETDQWTTFVLDLAALENESGLLNSQTFTRLWIKSDLDRPNPDNPYTFYLDGIQIFPTSQP